MKKTIEVTNIDGCSGPQERERKQRRKEGRQEERKTVLFLAVLPFSLLFSNWSFLFRFYLYFYLGRMGLVYECSIWGSQKTPSDVLNLNYRCLWATHCWCWETNSSPLKAFFATESPLQPSPLFHFFVEIQFSHFIHKIAMYCIMKFHKWHISWTIETIINQ